MEEAFCHSSALKLYLVLELIDCFQLWLKIPSEDVLKEIHPDLINDYKQLKNTIKD